VYTKLNWEIEPNIDISILYKIRAQQIRDKYKYLVLCYSGGHDSTEILWTFLNNNIFIDEIQVTALVGMLNKVDIQEVANDKDMSQLADYELTVKPMLKYVKKVSPNTKITVIDSSELIHDQVKSRNFIMLGENEKTDNNTVMTSKLCTSTGPSLSVGNLFITHNIDRSKDKDSVCLIRGYEKPILSIKKNRLFFNFVDTTMQLTPVFNKQLIDSPYICEDFFWSPDMPLIPIKQSHMIKRKLETNLKFYQTFTALLLALTEFNTKVFKPINSPAVGIERLQSHIIYPNFNPNVFTGLKQSDKSGEVKLYEKLTGDHTIESFRNEYRAFKEKKYEKIVHKEQFYRSIKSIPYAIGNLNFTFQTNLGPSTQTTKDLRIPLVTGATL
jgi:hypothetical protein